MTDLQNSCNWSKCEQLANFKARMLYKGKCLAKYRLLKSLHDLYQYRSEGYIIWGIYLSVGDLHFPYIGMHLEKLPYFTTLIKNDLITVTVTKTKNLKTEFKMVDFKWHVSHVCP